MILTQLQLSEKAVDNLIHDDAATNGGYMDWRGHVDFVVSGDD